MCVDLCGFYEFMFWFFLNATLVWHVATALCNIQQYEDWENDYCLDVIMCVLPVCGRLIFPPLVLSEF